MFPTKLFEIIKNTLSTFCISSLIYNINILIQLNACSIHRYESYWPVFLWNAHGVILIYNPEDTEQISQLERFYEQFVTNSYVPKKNTLIMAHTKKSGLKAPMPDFGMQSFNFFCLFNNQFPFNIEYFEKGL